MVASAAETAAFVPPRPRPSALRYDTEYPLIGYAERPTHNAIAHLTTTRPAFAVIRQAAAAAPPAG